MTSPDLAMLGPYNLATAPHPAATTIPSRLDVIGYHLGGAWRNVESPVKYGLLDLLALS